MIKKTIFTGALLLACSAMATKGNDSDVLSARPFPVPSCSVDKASLKLREHYEQNPMPTGDGATPWSYMPGVWLNESAGIFIQITTKKIETARYGIIQIAIKDLCRKRTLAQGSRVVLEEDFLNSEVLKIMVKNYQQNGASLSATFSFDGRPGTLQLELRRPRAGDLLEVLELDRVSPDEGSAPRR